MQPHSVEAFSRLLQLSISPIVLISGVGLLLLSITNRLARTIDRSRALVREAEEAAGDEPPTIRPQLRILMRRSAHLRLSIVFIAASVFLSTLMIILLFAMVFFGAALETVILAVFLVDVLCIAASVVWFLLDVLLSLRALRLETDPFL